MAGKLVGHGGETIGFNSMTGCAPALFAARVSVQRSVQRSVRWVQQPVQRVSAAARAAAAYAAVSAAVSSSPTKQAPPLQQPLRYPLQQHCGSCQLQQPLRHGGGRRMKAVSMAEAGHCSISAIADGLSTVRV